MVRACKLKSLIEVTEATTRNTELQWDALDRGTLSTCCDLTILVKLANFKRCQVIIKRFLSHTKRLHVKEIANKKN